MELQIDAVEAYYERGLCLQELTMHQDAVLDFDDALYFMKTRQLAAEDVYILPKWFQFTSFAST